MDTYPEKLKNSESREEQSPYIMFYWRLFLALMIPASILAGVLFLPVIFINWFLE
ncbi:MAG: hypothetical protein Q9P44_17920 [Anaerolineae bacterium]|nr:hypothetical protein [Anaerolineae bacterium]